MELEGLPYFYEIQEREVCIGNRSGDIIYRFPIYGFRFVAVEKFNDRCSNGRMYFWNDSMPREKIIRRANRILEIIL